MGTVYLIRSMDASEYAYLTRRNEYLEDVNAHLMDTNAELRTDNDGLAKRVAQLEQHLAAQKTLLDQTVYRLEHLCDAVGLVKSQMRDVIAQEVERAVRLREEHT